MKRHQHEREDLDKGQDPVLLQGEAVPQGMMACKIAMLGFN